MITFYVLVSARLSEKWQSKTLFSWKKISLHSAQISQKHTSYYQLTFSKSNRLTVSVICAWLSIKAISITTKESKTQAACSRATEPQAAHRMKRAGDFDRTGKCDWKSDRKCSTWRMRRRFAAVLPRPFRYLVSTWGAGNGLWSCAFRLSMIAPVKKSVNHSLTVASMRETGWEKQQKAHLRSDSTM